MEMNKLAQHIIEYDSDTFNADSADITETELKEMLDKIYGNLIDNEIDGVYLSQLLLEVRTSEDVEQETAE